MSLINQMLQDLEARGKQGQSVTPLPTEVRPVVPPQRTSQLWLLVLGLALLLLVLVIWMVPRQDRQAAPASAEPAAPTVSVAPAAPTAQAVPPAPAAANPGAPLAQDSRTSSPAASSANAAASSADAASSPAAAQLATSVSLPASVAAAVPAVANDAGPARLPDRTPLVLKLIPELTSLTTANSARPSGKPKPERAAEPVFVDVAPPGAAVATRQSSAPAARQANPSPPAAPADNSIKLVRQPLSPQQRAENEYRKAVQAHQVGRMQEAMTYLEQALQFDHQHTAARQTLVAWLLEQGQRPQAMAKLQEGLSHDPAQSGLAMILARLQVDQGDVKAALDTLNRSLPYTLGRADYQAFMAALLQREGRHKEAILRYQNALAINPDSAVWWMGIGISFQAEQQKAAARESFSRARGIGGLSPELQAFVEQRISQLH